MQHYRQCLALCLVVSAMFLGSCAFPKTGAHRTIALPSPTETAPRDYPGIHNAVAYHEGFISGSAPDGREGFDTLAAMGVRTIISVDGAVPDVETARALGLRTIHLPIGYNGFDEQRRRELTRATRDALHDGPVYIHCHHGKHRSAGAAAAIAVGLGWDTPERAVERMRVSGTAPNYTGLYACATAATVLSTAAIDSVPAAFPEVSRPADFVDAMVQIDDTMEHLKAIRAAGWTTPGNHPDLVPVAEAGRLADLLRLLADGDRARREPPGFARIFQDSSAHTARLEELLATRDPSPADLDSQFTRIAASCKSCHATYRD